MLDIFVEGGGEDFSEAILRMARHTPCDQRRDHLLSATDYAEHQNGRIEADSTQPPEQLLRSTALRTVLEPARNECPKN